MELTDESSKYEFVQDGVRYCIWYADTLDIRQLI
jgi:hypothetical protein